MWSLPVNMKAEFDQFARIAFLPDGRPCPMVLTGGELIALLCLDGPNPERTLKYWRDEGQLRAVRLGKKVRYRLEDVERFLEQKAGINGD